MESIILFFIFSLGSSIGSFINVVIWRLPREESIVLPGSYCPKCKTKIKWFDNIPLISFLILNKKCRRCNKEISINYFYTEFLTALIFVAVYFSNSSIFLKIDHFYYLVISFIFFTILIIQFLFDIKYYWLPDSVNIIGFICGFLIIFAYSLLFGYQTLFNHLFAALIGLIIFSLIYIFGKFIYKKEVIGIGDLKLISMIGIWVGFEAILLIIYLSFLSAGLLSSILIIFKKITRKSILPFGTFIITSTILVWLGGINLFKNLYFNLINLMYSN